MSMFDDIVTDRGASRKEEEGIFWPGLGTCQALDWWFAQMPVANAAAKGL